jgi:hypothetical protein
MSDAPSLRDNLAGAIDVMRGRAEGLARMDLSVAGFWRSFAAVLFLAPITIIGFLAGESVPTDGTPVPLTEGRALLDVVGTLVNFALLPLVFAVLAGPLGLASRYVPFVVARNWGSGIIALALTPIHALSLSGVVPALAVPWVGLAALAVELRLLYVIARTTLGTPVLLTLPIVVLDLLLSLAVWSLFDRLGAG